MAFLSLTASLTQRATVVSDEILDKQLVPPFSFGDALSGEVSVIEETGDPTAPSQPVALDSSNGVALTDGAGVIYAFGTNVQIANVNKVTFDLVVNSDDLVAALLDADEIEAFFEVRISVGVQDELLLREPVTITKSATATVPPSPVLPIRLIYAYYITSLRDAGATSLESVPTVSLGLVTLILTRIDMQVQGWLVADGTADPDNPDGQVQPLDYDPDNPKYFLKALGL